jgi:hypothetical protein
MGGVDGSEAETQQPQGRTSHARDEAWRIEEWALGKEGDEPQAGNRHWIVRGKKGGRARSQEEAGSLTSDAP